MEVCVLQDFVYDKSDEKVCEFVDSILRLAVERGLTISELEKVPDRLKDGVNCCINIHKNETLFRKLW